MTTLFPNFGLTIRGSIFAFSQLSAGGQFVGIEAGGRASGASRARCAGRWE